MLGVLVQCVLFVILNYGCYGYQIQCPDSCVCNGRNFVCSEKELTDIPKGILTAVKNLNLKKNQISRLPTKSFVKFKVLRQLNLGFNKLSEIEAGDFNGLVNVRKLDLSFNEIETIDKKSFKQLAKLDDLSLKGNKLVNVDGIFTMIGLSRLDLSYNQITLITSETFKNMSDLRYLLLGSNKLVTIQDKAFHDITRLTFISMVHNPITNVDGLFVKNNILSFLELTNCSLKTFPKGLPLITRFLYLDQNNITSITRKEIERVEYLVNLLLSENQIRTIEKMAFTGLNSLMELWLNFNMLTDIPVVSVNAKKLHLDNNEITHIRKDDFPFGSKLETLSMRNNQISAINKDIFENIKDLTKLFLGGNIITVLPSNAFKPLPLLDDLDLTGMDINFIETEAFNNLNNLNKLTMSFVLIRKKTLQGNVFKHLTNLKILDLQDSPLLTQTILESAEIIKSFFILENLNVMDNKLSYVNSNLMKYMPRLSIIKLGGNRFHCDRRLLWLWKWIDMEKYKFQDADSLECYSPPQLRGSSILSLKSSQFVPTTIKPEILSTKHQISHKTTGNPHVRLNSSNLGNETLGFVNINNTDISTTETFRITTSTSVHSRNNLAKFHNNKDKHDDQIDQILLITVVVTISIVLSVVVITVVSCLKCNRKKESYNHMNTFPENDVTFYVISDEAPPLPPPNSARKDRGSVGSTRDITGDNVFIFDNDSS